MLSDRIPFSVLIGLIYQLPNLFNLGEGQGVVVLVLDHFDVSQETRQRAQKKAFEW